MMVREPPNPQDPQRKPRKVMARARVFEQSIENDNERGSIKRKVMPKGKSRRASVPSPSMLKESESGALRDKPPVSPRGNAIRVNKLTVSPKRGVGLSPRRQANASTTTGPIGFKIKQQVGSNEDDEVSLGATEAETDSLDNPKHPQQSAIPTLHMKGAATENAFNDVFNRQQHQLKRLECMQRKREEESYRLEKIKGRRVKGIRTSLENYEKTIKHNKQFGFDSASPEEPKPPQRRITDVEAAAAAAAVDQQEAAESLVLERQAILADQLQDPRVNNLPQRRHSSESTLSPIVVVDEDEDEDVDDYDDDDQSGVDSNVDELPVPRIITFVEDDGMDNSEITISSRIRPKQGKSGLLQKQGSSRWESQPNNKKSTPLLDQDPICFRRPPPAVLKEQEDAGWAVHPRVVYGKPKTKKAVHPPAGRWAATGTPSRRKKGGPQFPNNESRWAAQPKKKFPVNASRLPKRQNTNDGAKGPVLPCNKPKRQATKEENIERAPRRGRRRSMIAQANEPPKVDLKLKAAEPGLQGINPDDKKENFLSAPVLKDKLLSRNLSLGEVKRIVCATRIQSVIRMYKNQVEYKMKLQENRKKGIEKETKLELQKIRDDLLQRKQSLRAASRGSNLSAKRSSNSSTASSTCNLNEDELRRNISEMERANSKLRSQCDRLRASNERMWGGNNTRDSALKEVQGRLSKLQHIQKKLNKVKEDFQKEYATIELRLQETNAKRKDNRELYERTKACLRKISPLVRSRLSNDLSKAAFDLMDEVENMVPTDCLL